MGNYNSEYESYYNAMVNNRKGRNYSGSGINEGMRSSFFSRLFSKQRIFRRVLQELIGGLLLFIILIFCKLNVLNESKTIYNYSKQIVHQNLDFKAIYTDLSKVKTFNVDDFRTKTSDFIEKMKISLSI